MEVDIVQHHKKPKINYTFSLHFVLSPLHWEVAEGFNVKAATSVP
jgi:hypothetical protein